MTESRQVDPQGAQVNDLQAKAMRLALKGGTLLGGGLLGVGFAWLLAALWHGETARTSREYNAYLIEHFLQGSELDRQVFRRLDNTFASASMGEEKYRAGNGRSFRGLVFPEGYSNSQLRWRFRHADFSCVRLVDATFVGAWFDNTSWSGSELHNVLFDQCSFWRARLDPIKVSDLKLRDCFLGACHMVAEHATFVRCDVRAADLFLGSATFAECDFERGRLVGRDLSTCAFARCSLVRADFAQARLSKCTFVQCDFSGANLSGADLTGCTFSGCDLTNADWNGATIKDVVLERCEIAGMNLWNTGGEIAEARALRITHPNGAKIEVDGLHVGVFVSGLLGGGGVRELVDGLSSTMVLLLGRFSAPHKKVLDDLQDALRALGFSAIAFDTEAPRSRDTTETIQILARLSRFVIADVTEPRSAPYEIQQFVSDTRVPLQIVSRGMEPFSMAADLRKYPWVVPVRQFADGSELLDALPSMLGELESVRQANQSSGETDA